MGEQLASVRREAGTPVKLVLAHVGGIVPLVRPAPRPEVHREIKPAFEFSKAILLEEDHFKTGSRTLDVAIAVLPHVVVIAGPILAGLYYTDNVNIKQFASMILVATLSLPNGDPEITNCDTTTAHFRVEEGVLGAVQVPINRLWGAQTPRSHCWLRP